MGTSNLKIVSSCLNDNEMDEVISLVSTQGWQINREFIKRSLDTDLNKLIRVYDNKNLVSIICYSNYGQSSWVGYSFTHIDYRGFGLNSKLKAEIINSCNSSRINLVCKSSLIDHNTNLGFKLVGKLFEISFNGDGIEELNVSFEDIDSILSFDKRILIGIERSSKLLRISNLDECYSFLCKSNDNIKSYGFLSKINGIFRIGPIVFDNLSDGISVLRNIVNSKIINGETVVFYTLETFLEPILNNFQQMRISGEYNLMSTGNCREEIANQLIIYGRATG